MSKTSSLTESERLSLHEIQRAFAMVRRRLRRRIDTTGTRQLFKQLRSAVHLHEDVATRTCNCAVLPADTDLQALRELALEAFVELGSQAEPKLLTLKYYDHQRFGPFLGVSDEGSAVDQICRTVLADPKCVAFETRDPMVIGLALDAERLGAIGEVAVGPEEYQRIRLDAAQCILTTTNVGTRVNIRHYKNRPVVVVPPNTLNAAVTQAVQKVKLSMQPFWDTPGGEPRPVTVLVTFVGGTSIAWRQHVLLGILREMTNEPRRDPMIHQVGLQQKAPSGRDGVVEVKRAIDLAVACGMQDVAVEGVQRAHAERAISEPGLLNYFPPGLLQEILNYACKRSIRVGPWKIVDTETTARNIWMGLSTARHMGLELGKYGLAPLTYEEQEATIRRIQSRFSTWCAAPVHYVDLPHIDTSTVYTEQNAVAATSRWLDLVGRCNVPVVLIDTAEKSKGKKLMKRGPADSLGIFSLSEIEKLNHSAQRMGVRVLWAGGLDAAQAYQLSQLGVFGLYVTSAVAEKRAVTSEYVNDPMLPARKEPQFDKILRIKVLTEAGFMVKQMLTCGRNTEAHYLKKFAQAVIRAHESGHDVASGKDKALRRLLVKCWRISFNAPRLPQSQTHPSINKRKDLSCD